MSDQTISGPEQAERLEITSGQTFGTPEEIEYELRAQEGSVWTGVRLVIGIAIFVFASLAFAYFYLRSGNNDELWRPDRITAPTGAGAAIMAFTVAAAGLVMLGARRFRRGDLLDMEVAGWTTVLFGLIATGLQIWQLTQLPFSPGSSGYASCFIGWAALNTAMLLGSVYWSETIVVRVLRGRGEFAEDGGLHASTNPAARLFRANLDASVTFWGAVAAIELFFWVLYYVI
jgi:heme/copper-type cytochrome/quinol oxidase subunit 3